MVFQDSADLPEDPGKEILKFWKSSSKDETALTVENQRLAPVAQ